MYSPVSALPDGACQPPSGDLFDLFDGENGLGGLEQAAGEDAPDERRDGDVLCGGASLQRLGQVRRKPYRKHGLAGLQRFDLGLLRGILGADRLTSHACCPFGHVVAILALQVAMVRADAPEQVRRAFDRLGRPGRRSWPVAVPAFSGAPRCCRGRIMRE